MLFNPALLSDTELITQFALRDSELQRILKVIEHNGGRSVQHVLVLGARGMGKTTLIRRVAAELRASPALREAWTPVPFPEEAYEVADLTEFWLLALRSLALSAREPELLALHARLHADRHDRAAHDTARLAMRQWAEQRACRLILMVENLDALLGDQLSHDDASALRHTLQTDPTFMLLATALTRFDAINDHQHPFYEGFRVLELEAATPDEARRLWERCRGETPAPGRVAGLRVLTGGNPRLIRMFAEYDRGGGVHALLDDLTRLLDGHTDYFKGQIEALSGHSRRVFLATATLWRPATAGQIAAAARLDNNITSTNLGRLESQGRVEVVGHRGKNKLYQVAERLFNIYYLMRQAGPGGDPRLRAVLDVLACVAEPAELGGMVSELAWVQPALAPALVEACERAFEARPSDRAIAVAQLQAPAAREAVRASPALQQDPLVLAARLEAPGDDTALDDAVCAIIDTVGVDPAIAQMAATVLERGNSPEQLREAAWWLGLYAPEALHAAWLRLPSEAPARPIISAAAALTASVSQAAHAARWLPFAADLRLPPFQLARLDFAARRDDPLAAAAVARAALAAPEPESHDTLGWLFIGLVEHPAPAAAREVARALHGADVDPAWREAFRALYEHEAGEDDLAHQQLLAAEAPSRFGEASGLENALQAGARLARTLSLAPKVSRASPTRVYARFELALRQHLSNVAWAALASLSPAQAPPVHELRLPGFPAADPRAVAVGTEHRAWWSWAVEQPAPATPRGWLQLGRLWGLLGRPDHALAALDALLAPGPLRFDRHMAVFQLIASLAASGQVDAVVERLLASAHVEALRTVILGLDPNAFDDAAAEERATAARAGEWIELLRGRADPWRPTPMPNDLGALPADGHLHLFAIMLLIPKLPAA